MKLLDIEENKTDTPIFVKEFQTTNPQTGQIIPEILIQVSYDNGMVFNHRYSDNMDIVQDIPIEFQRVLNILAAKNLIDKTVTDGIESKINAAKTKQTMQITEEKKKLITLLNQKGYNAIIPGVWEE